MTPDELWRGNVNHNSGEPARVRQKKVEVLSEPVREESTLEITGEQEIDRYLRWLDSTL